MTRVTDGIYVGLVIASRGRDRCRLWQVPRSEAREPRDMRVPQRPLGAPSVAGKPQPHRLERTVPTQTSLHQVPHTGDQETTPATAAQSISREDGHELNRAAWTGDRSCVNATLCLSQARCSPHLEPEAFARATDHGDERADEALPLVAQMGETAGSVPWDAWSRRPTPGSDLSPRRERARMASRRRASVCAGRSG
jgi:hypothetical protein